MSARRRLLITLALPAALLVGPVAGSASADVEMPAYPSTPAPATVAGGPGTLTLAAAAQGATPITEVEVTLPVDTPFQDVTVPAVDGWTSAAGTANLPSCGAEAVNHVTWTATGAGIAPQGTGSFALQVGRFPAAADQVVYQGTVTYADGTTVPFTEPGAAGAARPGAPVAVSAASTAPRLDVAPAPVTGGWMNSFVRMLTPVL